MSRVRVTAIPKDAWRLVATMVAVVVATASVSLCVDLDAVEGKSDVRLTTIGRSSGKPRSVTIWFVRDQNHLYVQSGKDGKTNWYRNILANPEVSLEIDSVQLTGRAVPIDDETETRRIHDLFRSKYLTARVMGWFGGGFGTGRVVRIESLQILGSPGPTP
jgi:deazaflavin-dependent oxidoreductase (nitroreductase family)